MARNQAMADRCRAVRTDIDAALAVVAAKYGVNLTLGSAVFYDDGTIKFKDLTVADAKYAEPAFVIDMKKHGAYFGLTVADIGKRWVHLGIGHEEFELMGMKGRDTVIGKMIKGRKAGGMFRFKAEAFSARAAAPIKLLAD